MKLLRPSQKTNVASAIRMPGTPKASPGPGRMPSPARGSTSPPKTDWKLAGSSRMGVSSVLASAPRLIAR